jgi:hypothetical protein
LTPNIKDFISNAYGPLTPHLKRDFLETLNHLRTMFQGLHWVVGGDFNLINSTMEKKGGTRILDDESETFKD